MVAAIYKKIGETMKLLWDENICLNTVHVLDVCRAIWFICERDDTLREVSMVIKNHMNIFC